MSLFEPGTGMHSEHAHVPYAQSLFEAFADSDNHVSQTLNRIAEYCARKFDCDYAFVTALSEEDQYILAKF